MVERMSDNRPDESEGKRALIVPLVIGAAVFAVTIGAVVFRPQHVTPAPAPAPAPPPKAKPAPSPLPPRPLSRAELIENANAAAAAFAAGETTPASDHAPLISRRFSIKIPFGCSGPALNAGEGQTSLQFDPEARVIKLSARAADWLTLPVVRQRPNAASFEAVEGFWLHRPWSTSESCPPRQPAQPAPASAPPVSGETIGLARFFDVDGSRVLRRAGRPYEAVRRVPEGDAAVLTHTYRLVLEGRLVGFGDGRTIHCWSESPDRRPVCLYAVEFDRVAFQDADDGTILGEWTE